MKTFFINSILITFFFSNCVEKPKFYEGYICNEQKKPLGNIKVCERNVQNCSETDSNGFFKIKKEKARINDLIVYYENKPIDTIKTVWSQHGEQLNYSFLEGKRDTLFLKIR